MSRIPVHVFAADPATGNALASVAASVKNRVLGTTATLYTAETGGSTVSNPLTTDANGRAFAWADSAVPLQIDYSGTGITAFTEYRNSPVDFVTALPGTPYDTQEIYFQNAAMATANIVWHLRYNASGGTYKWQYLGGSDLTNTGTGTTGLALASFTITGWTGSSRVTLPLAGDYEVTAFVNGFCTVGTVQELVIRAGVTSGTTSTITSGTTGAATSTVVSPSGSVLLTGMAAAAVVQLWAASGGGTWTFRQERIVVRPVRVG